MRIQCSQSLGVAAGSSYIGISFKQEPEGGRPLDELLEALMQQQQQQQQQQIGMGNVYQQKPRMLATTSETWCVAKPGLENVAYQGALDWVCSPLQDQGNVDCKLIQANQTCFLPNTYQNHASWAFNQYYQSHGAADSTCNFSGIAMTTSSNPSTATCTYEGNLGNTTGTTGDNNTTTTSAGSRVVQHPLIFQMSSVLVLLSYWF
ncbi:hypothetical protein CY35_01G116400 [Sphagnum magellanicum]|nr:hypothetical protein CY35_01G116400 [Sphagnum magellanicum]